MADSKEVYTGLAEKSAGAAPVDASQRHGASLNNARAATPNKGTLHWFAFVGQEPIADTLHRQVDDVNLVDEDSHRLGTSGGPDFSHHGTPASLTDQGKDSSGLSQKEREERIRNLRDRQNEERLKKLEELKSQALAAQKFREQKEEERRRRIDELRSKDSDRRYQVEERKRQIWEAERDRREAILRKNQEREARVDTKRRNERSSIVFAFGSSTPRMLEPADTGGSFWGTRRATSTSNVMMFSAVPLTRRSSERELDGSKKRAASASGLDRKLEEDMRMCTSMYGVFNWTEAPDISASNVSSEPLPSQTGIPNTNESTPQVPPKEMTKSSRRCYNNVRNASKISGEEVDASGDTAGYTRVHRKKTDLMPTIPSPRDLTPSRPSSVHLQNRPFSRSPGLRSGEITPSRPISALSQQSVSSVNTSGVSLRHRPVAAPRKPRPFSIAVTGVTQDQDARPATYRHSISGEIRSSKAMAASVERIESTKPPLPKPHVSKKPPMAHTKPETPARRAIKSAKTTPKATPKATPLQSPGTEIPPPIPHEQPDIKKENKVEDKAKDEVKVAAISNEVVQVENTGSKVEVVEEIKDIAMPKEAEVVEQIVQGPENPVQEIPKPVIVDTKPVEREEKIVDKMSESVREKMEEEVDMTASMIAKTRITTEEEAKAALAERRRLAREQAEREAELEKQRIEEERLAEEERQRVEEEEQIKFEEEQLRLVEDARRSEEARLLQAIQENEKQQEEDRKRREEEAKAKLEREEADKKAREEAERLRLEMDERLKKEEEERVNRRKRVEAIMLRTRGKGNTPANTPTKDGDSEGDEGKDVSPSDEVKSDIKQSAMLAASSADNHVSGNGQHDLDDAFNVRENGGNDQNMITTSASSELLLIDNTNGKPMEISDEDLTSDRPTNGHRNGVEYNNSVDFVNVDNMKQNKPSNNLLDFSEFESLSNNDQSSTSTTGLDQIMTPTSGKFIHEDNVNSNIMNGPNAPFIAFSDNLTKKQDSNTVSDLLS